MSNIINTKQNPDGSYSQAPYGINGDIGALAQYGDNLQNEIENFTNGVIVATNSLNQASRNIENANQRFWNAEFNRQGIVNNETNKYSTLLSSQNNLLQRINFLEIRLWRYKKEFSFRDNSGQLITGDKTKIEQELSSRYGVNVCIVNDLNDVLQNKYEIKINTIFIAINSISVVVKEIFIPNSIYEIVQDLNGTCRRNLLAQTRFIKKQKYFSNQLDCSSTLFILDNMTESYRSFNLISGWIKNIGIYDDSILLLVGNEDVLEGIVVNKVIKPLFNTGIFVTITDDMLKNKSFAEITHNKLFLHINQIPTDKENQKKLKELIISIVINKSIQADGCTIPTQAKVIVTLDEPHLFFKDCIDITTVVFIKTMDEILVIADLGLSSSVLLYQKIENSLDFFSGELQLTFPDSSVILSQKQRYIELLQEETELINIISDTGLPILDPYSDTFETLLPQGEYHTYITGQTRIGKSFLLVTLFVWYMRNKDCSLILFDVHGDLAKKAKMLVKDKKRLLYISNSSHKKGYSATINLFELSDKSEKNISKMANLILNVIKKVKADEQFSGPMEVALLRSIRVLLRKGNGSFLELYRMMNDRRNSDLIEYARKCGNSLDEEYFTDYFNDTNTKNAIRKRLDTLINDEDFVNLTHGESKIDFEKEINTPGKIIIIDIAKGDMDSYIYYIRFMMEYILVLALKRFDTPKEDRTMTHVIIDEFDNFLTAGDNIKTILKEAGKYNLFLTLAHQIISDIKDRSLRDTILGMTETKIVCRNSNKTLDAINKTHNINLEAENLNKGEQYIVNGNNIVTKSKNTTRFLDATEEISSEQWEEIIQHQFKTYYRPINQNTSSQQPTEDDLMQMIQQFKNDVKSVLSSKISIESSSLNNLSKKHSEKFDEIKSDITYFDTNKGIARPRIRQQEISTIFQMVFGLREAISNRKFIALLKSENQDDLFNQTDSGTRLGDFTDNGKTQTEQYYYLTW
ncbi:MAG: DUF87 domain-containing protein [Arcobacteraceae bacterium]|nr:DUF87 domain-containing protein [Arcobacteraceae bacterium]